MAYPLGPPLIQKYPEAETNRTKKTFKKLRTREFTIHNGQELGNDDLESFEI